MRSSQGLFSRVILFIFSPALVTFYFVFIVIYFLLFGLTRFFFVDSEYIRNVFPISLLNQEGFDFLILDSDSLILFLAYFQFISVIFIIGIIITYILHYRIIKKVNSSNPDDLLRINELCMKEINSVSQSVKNKRFNFLSLIPYFGRYILLLIFTMFVTTIGVYSQNETYKEPLRKIDIEYESGISGFALIRNYNLYLDLLNFLSEREHLKYPDAEEILTSVVYVYRLDKFVTKQYLFEKSKGKHTFRLFKDNRLNSNKIKDIVVEE